GGDRRREPAPRRSASAQRQRGPGPGRGVPQSRVVARRTHDRGRGRRGIGHPRPVARGVAVRRVAALGLLAAAPAWGQATGALAGRVRDASTGHIIVLARVSIDSGRWVTLTDTGGAYRVLGLASGLHRVTVSI